MPLVMLAGIGLALIAAIRIGRTKPDHRELARQIEARHPDLDGRLLTAIQQRPNADGQLDYLQQRVLDEALLHNQRKDWAALIPSSRLAMARLSQFLALVLFAIVLWELRVTGGHGVLASVSDSEISVTPGDVTMEKGSSLVVLARFAGPLPANVELVIGPATEVAGRMPLVKSLADPIFGGSVPEVTTNLVYHIAYGSKHTRDFAVTVFEYPRLERADADLTFPEYTGEPPKRIEDTRRLSAVEGSRLDLTLQLNKIVASATLVPRDKEHKGVALSVETNRPLATLKQFLLETSRSYDLHLVDHEGRTNKVQSLFVFSVLTNRTPELKLASPRGDVRPSPLEEIGFEGTVWDDFGIQSYGMGYTLAGQETKFIELGRAVPAREKHPFQHLLRLEDLKVQPDQLLAWFLWADDTGPDGQIRRTSGDLYFAEIRPFEEIFREGQGMEGQSGQQAGQQSKTSKLADLQKQIISATWRLQREHGNAKKPGEGGASSTPDAKSKKPGATGGHSSVREAANRFQISNFKFGIPKSAQGAANHFQISNFKSAISNFGQGRSLPAPTLMLAAIGLPQPAALLADAGLSEQGSPTKPRPAPKSGATASIPTYAEDAVVVRDSQAQALQQAQAASADQQDPRLAVLWASATKEMEKALAGLKVATNSPNALAEALAAEQAAFQALLKLQQHEYQVMRNQKASQGNSSREQQMQRQLEQMEMTQTENRYETQRQAQRPQQAERKEQLQVMNRLQELARRQQDLNERLKELQTALQEARTEQERQEIQRRLKRLQEEEQQMLGDIDELRQRMDKPENQSRMAEERRQLDETRQDVQKAAESAGQGVPSQALASGTRAQRQLQELRDQLRKENSSQFAEDLREMRAEARELARQQEDISKKLDTNPAKGRKSLSDSTDNKELLDKLAHQKEHLTNLVERASQISQQAEEAEPLLSRQLYDTIRKFNQDTGKSVKETQDELLNRGLMTRKLFDELKDPAESDGAKMLEATSELLRQGSLAQANQSAQRAGAGIDDLKRGVERAAESVLGDDTEALRQAQQALDKLTEQLQREMAQAEGRGEGTNQSVRAQAGPGDTNQPALSLPLSNGQQADQKNTKPGSSQLAQANGKEPQPGGKPSPKGEGNDGEPTQTAQAGQSDGQGREGEPNQTGQGGRNGNNPAGNPQRGGTRRGQYANGGSAEGGGAGDWGGNLTWNRFSNSDFDPLAGPITGTGFAPWSDNLRDVEEMIDAPDLRNEVAKARERARLLRQDFKRDLKKPDWAVVRLQIMKPLAEVRDRIADDLARRQSNDALVPIDRDPVPTRYSDLVRRYYEELGKEK
jgi:hypothetical protein